MVAFSLANCPFPYGLGGVAGKLLFIMNKNSDLKFSIYSLKRLYGQPAVLDKRTVGDVDYETGEQEVSSKNVSIARVVLLPTTFSMQRNYTGMSFKFGGEIKVGDREIIIDRADLPVDISEGDHIVISEKRYKIITILELDDEAYHIAIRNTQDE